MTIPETPAQIEALAPCPFCGGPPAIEATRYSRPVMRWIKCRECGASSTAYRHAESAIAAWNRRAPIPASRIREEALRALDALTAAARNDALDAAIAYLTEAGLPSKVVASMRRTVAPPASAYEPEYASILALIDAPQGGEGK